MGIFCCSLSQISRDFTMTKRYPRYSVETGEVVKNIYFKMMFLLHFIASRTGSHKSSMPNYLPRSLTRQRIFIAHYLSLDLTLNLWEWPCSLLKKMEALKKGNLNFKSRSPFADTELYCLLM
jgi:hypothetical protein